MSEPLEKYRRFIHEAQASVDYWADIPISEFGEDVCRLMDEQGVSRAELARRLGTSRAYVTKLLGGNANFTLQTMAKVAMALGAAVHVHVALKERIVRWYDEPPSEAAKTASEEAPRRSRKSSG